MIHWFVSFMGRSRGQMAITSQMIYARLAMTQLAQRPDALSAVEEAEHVEQEASSGGGRVERQVSRE